MALQDRIATPLDVLIVHTATVAVLLAEEALARIRSSQRSGDGDPEMISRHEQVLKHARGELVAALEALAKD